MFDKSRKPRKQRLINLTCHRIISYITERIKKKNKITQRYTKKCLTNLRDYEKYWKYLKRHKKKCLTYLTDHGIR